MRLAVRIKGAGKDRCFICESARPRCFVFDGGDKGDNFPIRVGWGCGSSSVEIWRYGGCQDFSLRGPIRAPLDRWGPAVVVFGVMLRCKVVPVEVRTAFPKPSRTDIKKRANCRGFASLARSRVRVASHAHAAALQLGACGPSVSRCPLVALRSRCVSSSSIILVNT